MMNLGKKVAAVVLVVIAMAVLGMGTLIGTMAALTIKLF